MSSTANFSSFRILKVLIASLSLVNPNTSPIRYGYSSLVTPMQILETDLCDGSTRLLKQEKVGGGFYALDLAGAAAGVLVAALFIIPIYGITNTLVLLSVMSGISLLTLLRRP